MTGADLPKNDSNRISSEQIWEEWAKSDTRIESKVLIFTNKDDAYDATQDFTQALRLTPKGTPNGVFNLYEASYSANNNLINSADATIPRYMDATFWTAISKEHKMSEVTRLAWYIPRNNTMITKPAKNRGYNPNTQVFLENLDNIGEYNFTEEEIALFRERINDYYIIVNTNVKEELANKDPATTITLTYYIEPVLIKH
jgi:hypothetical protein